MRRTKRIKNQKTVLISPCPIPIWNPFFLPRSLSRNRLVSLYECVNWWMNFVPFLFGIYVYMCIAKFLSWISQDFSIVIVFSNYTTILWENWIKVGVIYSLQKYMFNARENHTWAKVDLFENNHSSTQSVLLWTYKLLIKQSIRSVFCRREKDEEVER